MTSPYIQSVYSATFHAKAEPKARESEKEESGEISEPAVIESAHTEGASPIVFVPEKDWILCFFVDYLKVRSVAVRDFYDVPRMDECFGSLRDAQVFLMLDANSEYW